MTGFLYSFPFDMVVRIWDSFWLRRFDFFYAVTVGVFKITESITISLEMEQMMDFLKFRDGTRGLDFEVDQLIAASIHIFGKFKQSQLRQWELEARESISGKKQVDLAKRKENNHSLRLTNITQKGTDVVRTPRKFVKKFSSSITHSSSENPAELNDISVSKPASRKTRKTVVRRKKIGKEERTLSLPDQSFDPDYKEEDIEKIDTDSSTIVIRGRKKKKSKRVPVKHMSTS